MIDRTYVTAFGSYWWFCASLTVTWAGRRLSVQPHADCGWQDRIALLIRLSDLVSRSTVLLKRLLFFPKKSPHLATLIPLHKKVSYRWQTARRV